MDYGKSRENTRRGLTQINTDSKTEDRNQSLENTLNYCFFWSVFACG